jgi:hypothetical protein
MSSFIQRNYSFGELTVGQIPRRTQGKEALTLTTGPCSYTGTGTFSTISRSTWSDCSDFFSVEA